MRLLSAVIIFAIIYVVQKMVFSKNWRKGLAVSMGFSRNYIECGEKACLLETITNDKLLPLPVFHIKFAIDRSLEFDDMNNSVVTDFYHRTDVFSLMGRQRVERSLSFTGTKRGIYSVPAANILVKDFFLVSSYARSISPEAEIFVFPEKKKSIQYDLLFSGLTGDILSTRRLMTNDLMFRGVRDYMPYDRYRDINWKQSARGTGLKTNIYDFSMDIEVRILIDLDTDTMIRSEKLIEESISLASSIALDLLRKNLSVSIESNGTDKDERPVPAVPAGAEGSHILDIDRSLAAIEGSSFYERFLDIVKNEMMHGGRNVHYIIISPYSKESLLSILDRMVKDGRSISMIVPYYNSLGYSPVRDYIRGWEVDIYGA